MLEGFRTMLGGEADILISEEAATYRPEMEYLSRLSQGTLRVSDASITIPKPQAAGRKPQALYRFFELFDLPNIPAARAIMDAAADGRRITPPFKPWLEEKMWLALFWSRPLREFWRRELSERNFLILQKHIPQSWISNPGMTECWGRGVGSSIQV